MKMNQLSGIIVPALLLLVVTSCKKEVRDQTGEDNFLQSISLKQQSAEADLLQSVRNATSRFHSTIQAIEAGYEADEHCVSVPGLGGMGYHWVNPSLVDPVFDPLNPEAILYASGPGGKLHLVAVEYIVIDVGQPRPSFGDQLFDIGGAPIPVPHWTLHAWLYEANPAGMFKPFNPNVSCP